MTTNTPQAGSGVTDEQADEIANACYNELVKTGFNGGMGGLTWDRALVRAAIAQSRPIAQDAAYREAVELATSLFKKHYAHEEEYASGRVVWGQFDTTAGVITQIDNMVTGLSRTPAAGAGGEVGASPGEVPIAPAFCPITGRKFWGNIAHPKLGVVATYGGPLDTYTIPHLEDDGEVRCERFDQDAGAWTEGGEPIGWFYDDQQGGERATPVSGQGLTQDEIQECMNALDPDHDGSDFEPECPGCTAYKKLAAILASASPAGIKPADPYGY